MAVKRLRDTHRSLTRDALVDAAHVAFEEKGYVDTTVDDIVRRAGASRPTFYAHFDGKADVLKAVVEKLKLREEYQLMLDHFRAFEEPTVDALQSWFEEYVTFYEKNLRIHQAIHQAQVIDRDFATSQLKSLQEYVALWKSVGFVKDADSDSLRLAALMMYALGNQFMYLWLVHGAVIDRKKATRALAEALHATLTKG
jgi:AcrR family transcriptional regulator